MIFHNPIQDYAILNSLKSSSVMKHLTRSFTTIDYSNTIFLKWFSIYEKLKWNKIVYR